MMPLELMAISLKYTHIVFGMVGLLVLWIPVFATKGGKAHRRFGKMFEWCCYAVGTSGIISSFWWLVFPHTRPELAGRSAVEITEILPDLQFVFGLLVFLGVVLLSTTRFGVRLVRYQSTSSWLAKVETIGWATLLILVSLALTALAFIQLSSQGFNSKHSIFFAFPLIALIDVRSKLKFAAKSDVSYQSRLQQHADCMTGSAITFCTAFLVLGGNRIYGHLINETVLVFSFFVPALVGMTLNKLYSKKLVTKCCQNRALSTRTPVPNRHSN